MPILGTLLRKGIKIRESLHQEFTSPFDLQKEELKKLLITSNNTLFGKEFGFKSILHDFKDDDPRKFYETYKLKVPIYNYNRLHKEWWSRAIQGESDVCWPGKIKYFALSSGTSEASSKYLPITKDHSKAIQKTSIRQILTLSKYELPSKFFQTGILMLGGTTQLSKRGHFFEGDLTGIQAAQLPFWFQHFYKPGKRIAKTQDWEEKLMEITQSAKDWDIGIIVGVPAWIQILLEKIISYYNISDIHEIWPNLEVYVHGGVSFTPYKKSFQRLLGRPIQYIETYLASEGFIAFQANPGEETMSMVLNNGLFYEFVPFNDENIDENGEVRQNAQTLMIDEVEEGKEYALLLTTCAGAYRYMIGDVIRFESLEKSQIIITGRTKHFLSLCGEHLSVDNMNHAIERVSDELNIDIKEFAVSGVPYKTLFAHHWYIGTNDEVDNKRLKKRIDQVLMELNDDYRVERKHALKDVIVEVLPLSYFYDYLESKGKTGGQHKFPRVLRNQQLIDWLEFLDKEVHT